MALECEFPMGSSPRVKLVNDGMKTSAGLVSEDPAIDHQVYEDISIGLHI